MSSSGTAATTPTAAGGGGGGGGSSSSATRSSASVGPSASSSSTNALTSQQGGASTAAAAATTTATAAAAATPGEEGEDLPGGPIWAELGSKMLQHSGGRAPNPKVNYRRKFQKSRARWEKVTQEQVECKKSLAAAVAKQIKLQDEINYLIDMIGAVAERSAQPQPPVEHYRQGHPTLVGPSRVRVPPHMPASAYAQVFGYESRSYAHPHDVHPDGAARYLPAQHQQMQLQHQHHPHHSRAPPPQQQYLPGPGPPQEHGHR
ncbi:hypothetical protein V8E36_002200 [Tilletia maclaganii]